LERIAPPTVEEFRALARPVVIRGLRPLKKSWSFAELARDHGHRVVPVAITRNGTLQADARGGVRYTKIALGDYISRLASEEHPGLYLTTSLENFLPELLADLEAPPYCREARWRRSRLWMSAAGTVSPLHRDIAHNLIVQVEGKKRFWLWSNGEKLDPHPLFSGLGNFSRVDPEARDLPRRIEVILEPGEVLFLPSLWWHHARALERSLSVNFWWAEGWRSLLQHAAERGKRLLRLDDMKMLP
jgi:lysine-specific demethylase 8